MIGIIDYGMGNLASVKNALDFLGVSNEIFAEAKKASMFDKLILPGVGAFGRAMQELRRLGFVEELQAYISVNKRPVLGICLGMQLMLETSSEHGFHNGLSIEPGNVKFLGEKISHLPIPHVGWNKVRCAENSLLLRGVPENNSFYFVHSYYCDLKNAASVTGRTEYGILFDSVFEHEFVFGCQFHPEKSQRAGLILLKNFSSL